MVKEKDLDKKFNTFKPNINSHDQILITFKDSLKYLENNSALYIKLSNYFKAYYFIDDLIPQTSDNFISGHTFPYSESYFELENSYQLCLEGFYTYSFAALRSVLELGILGIYFAVNDKEYNEVRPWLTSEKRTPAFKKALKRLNEIPHFKEYDEKFDYVKNIYEIYDHLSGFIHTRGYKYSSRSKNRSNMNSFNEEALIEYFKYMFLVVSHIVVLMLIKYPIGMKELPLFDKFGFNSLAGGFLEPYQIEAAKLVLTKKQIKFLEEIIDNDPNVKLIIEEIESMPDISEGELQKQREFFEEWTKN
ncbi:hypothetical protein [Methanobacterium alcaliphilum]|uniref:hypothetical protein n=1 Tax=Methanobacterium alcaliphilum TaxID=392018 RepID=UPI00200A87A3|nr:hypothetical protein [Methanobacterium alcaliphilum]MCK9150478.1 hypothetical protein [Methanobacterium alcaliphilum]